MTLNVIDSQQTFMEQHNFLASVHSVSVIECSPLWFHLRGVNDTMISGLVLIWQYRELFGALLHWVSLQAPS